MNQQDLERRKELARRGLIPVKDLIRVTRNRPELRALLLARTLWRGKIHCAELGRRKDGKHRRFPSLASVRAWLESWARPTWDPAKRERRPPTIAQAAVAGLLSALKELRELEGPFPVAGRAHRPLAEWRAIQAMTNGRPFTASRAPRTRLEAVAACAQTLFDNRMGHAPGRPVPHAPRQLWALLGAALYGVDDPRVQELYDQGPVNSGLVEAEELNRSLVTPAPQQCNPPAEASER